MADIVHLYFNKIIKSYTSYYYFILFWAKFLPCNESGGDSLLWAKDLWAKVLVGICPYNNGYMTILTVQS